MAINAGDNLNSVPASQQVALASNYIDFATAGSSDGWAQQYLPDLMAQEAEVFGPRTISGFLSQVGAEEAMTSDQVVWSEQSRLHLSYTGTIVHDTSVFTVLTDIDGNVDVDGFDPTDHGIRLNDQCLVAVAEGTYKGICTAHSGDTVTIVPYAGENMDDLAAFTAGATSAATVLVYGSEFNKGVGGQGTFGGVTASGPKTTTPTFKSFTNKPIIMKDYYEVNGSDVSQVGWIEVSGEDGQNGYMWYLKAEGDVRSRFTDYLEMTMLEAEKIVSTSVAVDTVFSGGAGLGTNAGTEGLFAAITDRGNVTTGITGVNAATDLAEFDAILAEFDSQGAIEENMMFVNRGTSLAIDDMLASMNSYGAGGTSYGVFDNSEDMALNLGFSGFRRGSYDFYKSDFRYLNDKATRGGINSRDAVAPIRGVIIPAGTSSVYDQQLGKNMKRPFLHVRYRASQADNRKLKSWITGSVGAVTSDLDVMQMNFLSERCLITQGANNFMLMK